MGSTAGVLVRDNGLARGRGTLQTLPNPSTGPGDPAPGQPGDPLCQDPRGPEQKQSGAWASPEGGTGVNGPFILRGVSPPER